MGFGPKLLSGVFGGPLGLLEACFVNSSSTKYLHKTEELLRYDEDFSIYVCAQ